MRATVESHCPDLHMRIGRLLFGEHDEGLLAGQMFEELLGLTLEEEIRLAGQ